MFLETLIPDASIKSSIKHYLNRLSGWLLNRCQITTRNEFREIGLNWHSTFPRAEMLGKLVTKRIKTPVSFIPTSLSLQVYYFFRVVCFCEFGSQSIFAVEKGGLGELFLGCYLQ